MHFVGIFCEPCLLTNVVRSNEGIVIFRLQMNIFSVQNEDLVSTDI